MNCYMSKGTAEALEVSGLGLHHQSKTAVQDERLDYTPLRTQHDARGPLGFLLANQDGEKPLRHKPYFIRYRFQGLPHT